MHILDEELYQALMAIAACPTAPCHEAHVRACLPTGALCVALNNYHNMGPGAALRAESISLRDCRGLYDFPFFLATEAKAVRVADEAVTERFVQLEAKALSALKTDFRQEKHEG